MEVRQIYELVNNSTKEILGETALIQEDLSNVVEIGEAVFNADAVDAYVKSLVNHIGKVIFVNRPYSGAVPSVMMDRWEFGSVLEKIQAELPEAKENESWSLADGESYDPNIFKAPQVSATFYNKRVTFEVQMSFTDIQVKQSFSSADQLNAFVSMIYNAVDKSMTVKIDNLIMKTINNMIGETIYSDYEGAATSTKSGVKAINLLKSYNDKFAQSLTADEAITDADFLRYASFIMGITRSRLTRISRLFNIEKKDRFTPLDLQHVVLLAEFARAADAYLQSDVYHNELTNLPSAEVVPYWQAPGTDYSFNNTSKIKIKTSSGHDIEQGGILGVIFDRDALGVCNLDRRVTTNYNPVGEFRNNWFKFDGGYFNSLQEQAVVFFVA